MPTLPKIAVTMGDPAGIGPEVCLRLLADASVKDVCAPIIFGDARVMARVARKLGWAFDDRDVFDLRHIDADSITPGQLSAACGEAAYQYVIRAIEAGLAGEVAAITTGPLNKEALHAAGHFYPGHTELFAERMSAARSCMLQYSDEVTCSFVTVHVGYAAAPKYITVERIIDVIELTHEALVRIRGRAPKLVVCGLNPHAGEHGLFGEREEERIIVPAIEHCRARGIDLIGPLPPDTCFLPQRRKETDAFICMYHDQGHIPLKALAFDSAINTTLGLPVVRTSVDHGTAFDIAWQGTANAGSMIAAVKLAAKLVS